MERVETGELFGEAWRLLRQTLPRLRLIIPLTFFVGFVAFASTLFAAGRKVTIALLLLSLALEFLLNFWFRSATVRTLFGRQAGRWRMDKDFWRYSAANLPLILVSSVLPQLAGWAGWTLISILPAPGFVQWMLWACLCCAAASLIGAAASRIWPWITALVLGDRALKIKDAWRVTGEIWWALAGVATVLAFGLGLPHYFLLYVQVRHQSPAATLMLAVAHAAWMCAGSLIAAALAVVIYRIARARADPSDAFS